MPAQCPECARFLANALVEGLRVADADCPHCGARLTASAFAERLGPEVGDDGPEAPVPGDRAPDPLEGWDVDGEVIPLHRRRSLRRLRRALARPPALTGTVLGAAAGALLGAAVGGSRRGVAATIGAVVVGAGAAVATVRGLRDAEVIRLAQ